MIYEILHKQNEHGEFHVCFLNQNVHEVPDLFFYNRSVVGEAPWIQPTRCWVGSADCGFDLGASCGKVLEIPILLSEGAPAVGPQNDGGTTSRGCWLLCIVN